ncbi:histidine kinase [Romeria aff. gracilis LEGE 07310]|uniref:Histidine kinase n=1 Tax=Vasconcelosia minhoensis LEGE 07310 TaxID=915328 RepID=A0A8J7AJY7_9CYAN|nr:histidine kinase [Romeria gracilis]MBE9076059.1 histidine kinase [Romeria aff. gracilis LEGE 07310]
MPRSVREQVSQDIQAAKQAGQVRAERLKEIVRSAVAQARTELQGGSQEVGPLLRAAIAAVIDSLQDRGETLKQDVAAAIEGGLDAVSQTERQQLSATQAEIKRLQAQADTETAALQRQVDSALDSLKSAAVDQSEQTQNSLTSAIDQLKDSEESQLMQKRYAQLKTQLAILQANLSARYGEQSEVVKQYLDEAQDWYQQMKPQMEEIADTVAVKQANFEARLADAGKALAQREQSVKQTLRELWESAREAFNEGPDQDKR